MNRNLKSTNSSISAKLFLKRILITLLTTTLFAGALPQTANAAATTFSCSLGGTYTITDGVVDNGIDCAGELNIGSTARSIAGNAFGWTNSEITSIILPDSITSIAWGAFTNLQKIVSVTIPKNVSTMYGTSFSGGNSFVSINVDSANPSFSSVDGVLYDKNKTKIVAFPSGKDSSNWSMPTTVTTIGDHSFAGNQKITRLSIPNGVTTIEGTPFNDSRNLAEVVIPSTVIEIQAPQALSWNNRDLKSIEVDSNNPNYSSSEGVLFNKNKTILFRYPQGKLDITYNVPTTVETLYQSSFSGQTQLKTLILPNSLKTILAQAFWATYALTSIDIPQSVTSISTSSLFYGSDFLESINVAASNPNYKSVDGILFSKDGSVLIHYPANKVGTSYTVPSQVKTISEWAFQAASLDTVILPEGITEIQEYAFYLSEIKALTIPNSVNVLGVWVFAGIDRLKSYKYCSNTLSQATLDDAGLSGKPNVCGLNAPGTPSIGTVAATGATSATVEFSAPASNGGSAVTSYTAISTPGGVTGTIEQAGSGTIEVFGLNPATSYTFTVVASNVVGDSVASAVSQSMTTNGVPGAPTIGKATATGSAKATIAFTAPANNGGLAIYGYTATSTPGGITGYLQQEGSGEIEVTGLDPETSYTFKIVALNNYGSSVESASSNEITTDAASIKIPCGGTGTYTIEDGVARNGRGCTGDLTLSDKVRVVGWAAFEQSSALRSITFPKSVKTLEGYSVGYSPSLTTVNIPSSVETISEYAFSSAGSLRTINVDSANSNFSSVNGILYNKDKTKLIKIPAGQDLSDFSIPATAKTIGSYAISNIQSLIKLSIPNGITDLEANSIISNNNLRIINISKSVKSLTSDSGNSAISSNYQLFKIVVDPDNANYVSANGVLFNKDKSTLYNYPTSKQLSTYEVPSTVKKIADNSFQSARFLTSITLPNSLTDIGSNVFSYAELLEKIVIPASVKNIGTSAFIYAKNLQSISVDPANQSFSSQDGVLFNNDKSNLILYPKAKSGSRYEVPVTVKYISDAAFQSSTLTSIVLPDGLLEIGDTAFSFMMSLRKVDIPDSVETINNFAFYTSVKNTITIPNNIKSVGSLSIAGPTDVGFIYCGSTLNIEELISQNSNKPNLCGKEVPSAPKSASAVTVDESTAKVKFTVPMVNSETPILSYTVISNTGDETTLLANEFAGEITVSGLKPSTRYTFTVVATNIAGDSTESNVTNAIITSASTSAVITSTGTLIIPCGGEATYKIINGVVSGGGSCTGDLVIDSRATSIGDNAFSGSYLGAVTLPDTISSIGNYALWSSKLTSINIPEKVTSIGEGFLGEAQNIKSISIPKSVKKIGPYAFYWTKSLESITVDPDNANFTVFNGALLDKAKTKILSYPAAKSPGIFKTPESVVKINEDAFFGSAITSITIPKDLIEIGESSFGNNASLGSILLDPANPNFSLVDGWLYNADKTILMLVPADKNMPDVVIPNGITSISGMIFGNLAKTMKTLFIPASVVSLGTYSIKDATSLTSITVDPENPTFASIDGVLFNKEKTQLYAYPNSKSGTSYTIPDSVTSMPSLALSKESYLTSIFIPENLSSIDSYALNNATSLVNINVDPANPFYASADGVLFDKGIKRLIAYPQNKPAIQYAVPEGVISISDYAFGRNKNLKSVTTPKTLLRIGYSAFESASSLKTISLNENILLIEDNVFIGTPALGYQYCGTEYSILEIGSENTGLEGMKNVCGKSLPGTVKIGAAKATGTTTATVAFTAPSDGGSPIISYTAISNTGAVTTLKSSAAAGEILITGLSPATNYTFKLFATNLVGDSLTESAQSNSISTLKLTAEVENFANLSSAFGASSLTIKTPTSDSDGAWSYSSSDPKVVAVMGSALEIVKGGSVTITATQAATALYAATTKTFTVEVKPIAATLGALTPIATTASGLAVTITAPSSTSNGAWSYTLGDPTLGTVTGSSIVFTKAGTTTVVATQAATDSYLAGSVTTTVEVKPIAATLGALAPISASASGLAITITAPSSTSTGAWSYTLSDPTLGTVTGSSIVFTKAGTTTIVATQAATDSHLAGSVTTTVEVKPIAATLGSLTPIATTASGLAITITAPTSTSTGAWSYTLSDPTLGTVTGSSIVFTKAGTTTVVATQAATESHLAGSVTTTVTVKPYVMVKASKRTINVTVKGAKGVVKINGKAAKAGVNKVKAGKNLVTITVGGVKVYTKTFKVK